MISDYEIRNEISESLEIWVEPWCHPYFVPRGSTLRLIYVASAEWPILTELTPERLVVWTNSKYEPTAELDGKAVSPDFSQ
jgi:hypothetical protein